MEVQQFLGIYIKKGYMSTVNKAGNYTKPTMRKKYFKE